MKKCVVTLPLTAVPEPSIGFFLTPLVGSIISKCFDIEFIIGLNLIGKKLNVVDRNILEDQFNFYLKRLNISYDGIWVDNNEDYFHFVKEIIKKLHNEGNLIIKEELVYVCKCGAVEIAERAIGNFFRNGKLFMQFPEKNLTCKICKTDALPHAKQGLYFKFQKTINWGEMQIFPSFYNKEAIQETRLLFQNTWRISRLRETTLSVEISNTNYYIDTDFIWSMMFTHLNRKELEVTTIITSNRTMRQSLMASLINKEICEWKPKTFSIILTPYLLDSNRKKMSDNKYLASNLCKEFEPNTLRFWIASSLNWKLKETVLDTRSIHWVLHSLNNFKNSMLVQGNSFNNYNEFIHAFNSSVIHDSLTSARKNKPMPENANKLLPLFTTIKNIAMNKTDNKFLEDFTPFIEKLKEEFGTELKSILMHGSALNDKQKIKHDCDLVIVVNKKSDAILKIQEAAKLLPHNPQIDFQLIYFEQINSDGSFFSLHTCGPFFLQMLKNAKILFGYNPFIHITNPTSLQIKISLLQKVQQYIYVSRKSFLLSSNSSVSDATLLFIFKKVWMIIKDLLIWIEREQDEAQFDFVELNSQFPDLFSIEQKAWVRDWLDWHDTIDRVISALTNEEKVVLLNHLLVIQEILYQKLLDLAREKFDVKYLSEISF